MCWKCSLRNATFLHMWWESVSVNMFWRDIKGVIQDKLRLSIPFNSKVFLLCWFETEECKRHKHLLINLLTAVSIALVKVWKVDKVPSLFDWYCRIYFVCLMSKLTSYNIVLSGMLWKKFKSCWYQVMNLFYPGMERLLSC